MEDVCEIAEEFVEVRIGGGGCESVVGIGVILVLKLDGGVERARGTRL